MSTQPRIGRFIVRAELGRGGQGAVYRATDPDLDRDVALKVVIPGEHVDVTTDCLVKEARAAARIAHPNVIPIYDVLEHGGRPVLVFEHVQGRILKEALREHGPWAESDALSIMVRIAVGLAAAHEQGIMHLDLSPQNVMLDREGRPRIMDFGLARLRSGSEQTQSTEALSGTPRYMSPEHLGGERLTPATDVFALGLVFYELLTGVPAINQRTIIGVMDAVRDARVDWLRLQGQGISAELVALLRDMLQVDPACRYPSAVELVPDLDRVIAMHESRGNETVALDFLQRRLKRRPEFPAFSHTIVELNRLTAAESTADFDRLGRVILRDYSMTNRFMKIANSAFFDRGGGGVRTVSQAIGRLGLDLVRLICNGMQVFDKFGAQGAALQDAMVRSFIAGLIARHLAAQVSRPLAEEAFICGLFHRLGRNLVMYYLPLEHEDIAAASAAGAPAERAEIEVLGVAAWRLGAAVARQWKFPETIVASMAPTGAGLGRAPADAPGRLQAAAAFANELCELGVGGEPCLEALEALLGRYRQAWPLEAEGALRLLEAALERLSALAPSLGVDCASSETCKTLAHLVATLDSRLAERDTAAAAAVTG